MASILTEWLWSFLPDRCEMPGCSRQGIRGNEGIIDGKLVCAYCYARISEDAQYRYQDVSRSFGGNGSFEIALRRSDDKIVCVTKKGYLKLCKSGQLYPNEDHAHWLKELDPEWFNEWKKKHDETVRWMKDFNEWRNGNVS